MRQDGKRWLAAVASLVFIGSLVWLELSSYLLIDECLDLGGR